MNVNPQKPLAAAPKRAPLQPTLKPLQECKNHEDMAGTGSGKENLPQGVGARSKAERAGIKGSKARRLSMLGSRQGPKCGINSPHLLVEIHTSPAHAESVAGGQSVSFAPTLKMYPSNFSKNSTMVENPL